MVLYIGWLINVLRIYCGWCYDVRCVVGLIFRMLRILGLKEVVVVVIILELVYYMSVRLIYFVCVLIMVLVFMGFKVDGIYMFK